MKNCMLALAYSVIGLGAPAWAQNPDLKMDPGLLVPVPKVLTVNPGQILADRERLFAQTQARADQIETKYQALIKADIAIRFIIPNDRAVASQALQSQAQSLSSRDTQGLRYCILNHTPIAYDNYQADYTSCASSASAAWSSTEIRQNPTLQRLLEAMVFRSRDDLSALQGYIQNLNLNRLAYTAEVREFGVRTSELEFAQVMSNPDYQCGPGLGTVRLDEPSIVGGHSIPMTMHDVLVQDQGPLGTCYANAASVALETLTGQPNSAVDLAIRFSMNRTAADKGISPDFGGSFCGAVQVAQAQGLCRREDSWIEAGTASVSTTGKSLPILFEFLDKKSRLTPNDLALLTRESASLVTDLLGVIQGTTIPTLESPMVRNLNSFLSYWVSRRELAQANYDKIKLDLRAYEKVHADEYLPKSGRYYKEDENAGEALARVHMQPMLDIVKRNIPGLTPTYIESQMRPYLSQGFAQLADNYALDRFRADLARFRVVQAVIDARLKTAKQPEIAQSMLIDIVTLIQMSKNANPGAPLSSEGITRALFQSQSKNVNQALLDIVAPNCQSQSHRYVLKAMSCRDHRIQSAQWLTAKMLQTISHGRPLGLSYCAEVLGQKLGPVNRVNGCGGHVSLLTGIRYNPDTRKCDALIWNSWGKATGKTWIDIERLLPYAMGVQEVVPAVSP
ncbi:MAG: hypothetical protein JST80_03210 [Bdellovibrionales bacterium]|nr:hypothetical protein [Bdellovibrionales bacterium]